MVNDFACDYANRGTSSCKRCKQKLPKGSLRLAKVVPNPFSESEDSMKTFFHVQCLFESFEKARATTKIIECSSDIDGFAALHDDDKDSIKKLIDDITKKRQSKVSPSKAGPGSQGRLATSKSPKAPDTSTSTSVVDAEPVAITGDASGESVSFTVFSSLTDEIANESTYAGKTAAVRKVLTKMTMENKSEEESILLLKLLLPGVIKRVYNLHNKQLLKHFSTLFNCNLEHMSDHLDNSGDVSLTIEHFFQNNSQMTPETASKLCLIDVDKFLDKLTTVTLEKDQESAFARFAPKCTAKELRTLIRLIKHDLRMNAGAKPVLDALDPRAYEAFQTSRDLRDVVKRVNQREGGDGTSGAKLSKQLSIKANLMTPILPMLAEACKSAEYAMQKCPNGMFSEIKYDGERVQVHKKGTTYSYFSRSLKPVVAHKVEHIKEYLPQACPKGNDMILDSEVLLVDTNTGKPLPFGTLGVHKKNAFSDASVCLFIFDCILFNEETLIDKPIDYRKKILHENIKEIPNKIMLSEYQIINSKSVLNIMIMDTLDAGLEGLVLKDMKSVYEPGKRHWLKVKKDYLAEGAMADSADLVCLGGYYGTGSKGGLMSSFLMCVHDPSTKSWLTVTKVSNGFTDAELAQINKNLKMKKISRDSSQVPHWLKLKKQLAPDFVITDVTDAPVWEITGAEFSQAEVHTAGGISIRFPRVTKIRDDKTWKEATNFERLKLLVAKSKETSDIAENFRDISSSSDHSSSTSSDKLLKKSPAKTSSLISPSSSSNSSPRLTTQSSVASKTPTKQKSSIAESSCSPPKKAKLANQSVTGSSSLSLKNIFTGMKLHIIGDKDSEENAKLARYFTAYDGDVVESYEVDKNTLLVTLGEYVQKTNDLTGKNIQQDWIFDSVKVGNMLSVEKYLME